MFWGIFALTLAVWLTALFFIVKGLKEPKGGAPEKKETQAGLEEKEAEKDKRARGGASYEEAEIEIPESLPAAEAITAPAQEKDPEDFYERFGRSNIVEFPADYIDDNSVKGINGSAVALIDFTKNCYRQINFQCTDTVMAAAVKERTYRVNIFDLVADHYFSTEEDFIVYFARLKEKFAREIESIASHPALTEAAKRSLVGKYESLPQLLAWNKTELFLITVKVKGEPLKAGELSFLKEFVVDKRLFKAKIFRITKKEEKRFRAEPPRPGAGQDAGLERPAEMTAREPSGKNGGASYRKKIFTKEEIKFLKEHMGELTNEKLAQTLGRSVDSVTHKLSRLGIAREGYEWTREKDDFLKKNIARLSYRQLAAKLGTTMPSVRARCKRIGVKK